MPNKTIVAIGALATIVIICIFRNIDGALIGSIAALIAGLGGYALGKAKK